MTSDVILAIDGGATRTRCAAIDRGGRVLGRGEGGPANHLLVAHPVVRRSLARAIDEALVSAGIARSDVRCVAAGLAGVDYDGAGADVARTLFDPVGSAELAIDGDIVIAHRAAFDGGPGVLALAGTGSAILGIAPDGSRSKVGGWGPLYGNQGSAYWIARQALVAAASSYDGLGPPTSLVDAILGRLGLREFRETIDALYAAGLGDTEIAALAPVVDEAAARGDAVACAILEKAGHDLADGVVVLRDRLRLDGTHGVVSYHGTVLEGCRAVREAFIQALQRRVPDLRIEPPKNEPLIGAWVLGREVLDARPAGAGGSR